MNYQGTMSNRIGLQERKWKYQIIHITCYDKIVRSHLQTKEWVAENLYNERNYEDGKLVISSSVLQGLVWNHAEMGEEHL